MVKSEDEVYCSSCGELIKTEAEICPHCGVRQKKNVSSTSGIQEYELQKLARKDSSIAIILGFLISPFGYVYVGKWSWAFLNFFTLNYFLLGVIIVPIHTYSMISGARKDLDALGVDF
jgi:zinc-ribbon domain